MVLRSARPKAGHITFACIRYSLLISTVYDILGTRLRTGWRRSACLLLFQREQCFSNGRWKGSRWCWHRIAWIVWANTFVGRSRVRSRRRRCRLKRWRRRRRRWWRTGRRQLLGIVDSASGRLRHQMQWLGVCFESRVDARTIDVIVWIIFDWSFSTICIRIGCGNFDNRLGATVGLLLIVILFG